MNVLIVGAGAIGCLLGGKLALSNAQVTLAGRQSFVDALRSRGLLLEDEGGKHVVRNLRGVTSPMDAFQRAQTAFDLAVITVKSYDTDAAVKQLTAAVHDTGAPAPAVLSVQNGVGNEDMIAAALPAVSVLAGSITTPVSVEGPGSIRVEKPRYGLGLGLWRSGANGPAVLDATAAIFTAAGFAVQVFPNAQAMKWTKLLMNMMGNATCAILDEPPQTAFADSRIIDLEIAAWREALAVMRAANIPALNMDKYPFATLAPMIRLSPNAAIRPLLRSQVAGARGGKLPSLHIDLHAGKPRSEVNWLNGAVAAKGREVGVPTPVNAALVKVMNELLADPKQVEGWRGAHDRLVEVARGVGK